MNRYLIIPPILFVVLMWAIKVPYIATLIISVILIPFFLIKEKPKINKPTLKQIAITLLSVAILVLISSIKKQETEVTVLSVLAIVLLGPINEEIIFRYFSFKKSEINPIIAALISTALFAVAHGLDPMTILITAVAGFIFCALYYLTDNFVLTVIAHILANAILFLI